jgi:hypothetical protein
MSDKDYLERLRAGVSGLGNWSEEWDKNAKPVFN